MYPFTATTTAATTTTPTTTSSSSIITIIKKSECALHLVRPLACAHRICPAKPGEHARLNNLYFFKQTVSRRQQSPTISKQLCSKQMNKQIAHFEVFVPPAARWHLRFILQTCTHHKWGTKWFHNHTRDARDCYYGQVLSCQWLHHRQFNRFRDSKASQASLWHPVESSAFSSPMGFSQCGVMRTKPLYVQMPDLSEEFSVSN